MPAFRDAMVCVRNDMAEFAGTGQDGGHACPLQSGVTGDIANDYAAQCVERWMHSVS